MADNINLETLVNAATASMLPVGDEELNALWGRKTGANWARAVGAWGTVVATTTTTTTATAQVDFSSLNFNLFPSIDIMQLRGGSYASIIYPTSDNVSNLLGVYLTYQGGTSLQLTMYGDAWNGTLINFSNYGTWQKDFGTFIYRFRGW